MNNKMQQCFRDKQLLDIDSTKSLFVFQHFKIYHLNPAHIILYCQWQNKFEFKGLRVDLKQFYDLLKIHFSESLLLGRGFEGWKVGSCNEIMVTARASFGHTPISYKIGLLSFRGLFYPDKIRLFSQEKFLT